MPMKLFGKPNHLQNKLTFFPLFWFAVGLMVTFLCAAILLRIYLDKYLMTQTIAYTQQIASDLTLIIQQDEETIKAFISSDSWQDLGQPGRLTNSLEKLLQKNKNFLEGYVANRDGKTVVAVSLLKIFRNRYPDFKDRFIYQQARRGATAVSGWENLTEKYRPYWYLAVPLEKYAGEIIGVLIVTIDLRRISDEILTSQGARYGNPILIDRNANILVHLDQSLLGKKWNNPGVVQKIYHGEVGTAKYVDSNKQYVLAAYQPLNPYGWGLIVQIPPEQTIYIIRNKLILLLGLMTIAIFIVTGWLTYFAAGKIVTPINKLTKAALEFGKESKTNYALEKGDDEIAQLSAAFFDMSLRITHFERQRAQYISMIAHDIRNPLASIEDLFRSPQNHPTSQADHTVDMNTIKIKLEQANRMIDDLLEFSRLDLEEISFFPEIISVRYLCQDVISGYLGRKNRFHLQPFSETICVWADPVRLEQILQNILDNCLKYTPENSPVTIDCTYDTEFVRILIRDSGQGISAAELVNLFKPFQSPRPQGIPRDRKSYGLGMAIAKKLANGMGGDLLVDSVPQQGSTFIILLPGSATVNGMKESR